MSYWMLLQSTFPTTDKEHGLCIFRTAALRWEICTTVGRKTETSLKATKCLLLKKTERSQRTFEVE